MKILIAVPHYFGQPTRSANHGSSTDRAPVRIRTLRRSLWSVHQTFGRPQCLIQIDSRKTMAANDDLSAAVDIVVCCIEGRHLLNEISADSPRHQRELCDCEPLELGFECYRVLRERFGDYDWYGYMEDDLIHHDSWFFTKLEWFSRLAGADAVLLPNRYERGINALTTKAYLDGDLRAQLTDSFQDISDRPLIESSVLGRPVSLQRPRNPHSGCWFLAAEQMDAWLQRDDFGSRDTSFIGPLESAATLGLMSAFRVYKPSPATAGFLEIEHAGSSFVSQLRRPETGDV